MYPGHWGVETPDKPAAIDSQTGETVTFHELNERSNQLAQLFHAKGLRRGDHVALFMENRLTGKPGDGFRQACRNDKTGLAGRT